MSDLYCPNQWAGKRPTFEQLRNTQHPIDNWIEGPGDDLFQYNRDVIIVPVSKTILNTHASAYAELDSFSLKVKKRYLDGIKEKICRYMNYFLKYYDTDKELIYVYSSIKATMDLYMGANYTEDMFLCDIKRCFLTIYPGRETILSKVRRLNTDQFGIKLNRYVSTNDALCYDPEHVKIMMEIAFLMDMLIPLCSHYCSVAKILDFNKFFIKIVQILLDLYPDVDIHSKIQETVLTLVASEQKADKKLWDIAVIRGIDIMTNTCTTVDTILESSFPKYTYNENPLNYNIAVIRNVIKHNITEISYEYDFIVHDSSKRDGEDMSSPMDRFEMQREKSDQGLMIQNEVNCRYTLQEIYEKYGRPSDEEVNFYIKEMTKYGPQIWTRDGVQRRLILNFWNEYFGDTASIREIQSKDYVRLIILAKQRLLDAGLTIFPYIISSRFGKLASKSMLNKREAVRIEQMEEFKAVQQKYMSPKIISNIIENIATLLSSEFYIIEQSERNGLKIPTDGPAELIIREYLRYVLMI